MAGRTTKRRRAGIALLAGLAMAVSAWREAAAEPLSDSPAALANGIAGRAITFASATPRNYEDIVQRRAAPAVRLQARLFMPRRQGRAPAVIIVPGAGGINPWMLVHAGALTDAGFAVLLIDPFGGRGIRDTIAAQDQMSFAASAYDVLAAARALEGESGIDAARIGALGYSRGGLAVLQAAMAPLAGAVLGPGKTLRAVLAGWPWCGQQFAEPRTGATAVRILVGDSDNWVSPAQCQGYFTAMKARSPAVSLRLFRNADHGFGYGYPVQEIPNAIKALNAPIAYFDERGVLLDPWTGQPLPGMDERAAADMYRPFISRGVRAGTRDGQMAEFIADFLAFFRAQL